MVILILLGGCGGERIARQRLGVYPYFVHSDSSFPVGRSRGVREHSPGSMINYSVGSGSSSPST
jgi:hypothetical protein